MLSLVCVELKAENEPRGTKNRHNADYIPTEKGLKYLCQYLSGTMKM